MAVEKGNRNSRHYCAVFGCFNSTLSHPGISLFTLPGDSERLTMDWVLRSPQIHSTFSNLGYTNADGYHINENCNVGLETILNSIITEDKYLRSYRRNISFGQNIKKDLIPLLVHAKEDKTIELLIKIFVNLTTPIECLFNIKDISKTDFGRHTVFEINNLLTSIKTALTDHRATKVIIEFLKKNSELEQNVKLTEDQCTNVSNSLLLLRNILHIPDDANSFNTNYSGSTHSVQNQIMWNLFSQSIDKILIKLISVPDTASWGVTMVQLIALLYKDQHVTTLHKLLNMWLETSLSESSEDNESNTSPPNRSSNDSSPMLTSDPTSDSSDTGASGKINGTSNSDNNGWQTTTNNCSGDADKTFPTQTLAVGINEKKECEKKESQDIKKDKTKKSNQNKSQEKSVSEMKPSATPSVQSSNYDKKNVVGENSDCGYGTQIETQESISTSSNEDDLPSKKPAHQKPHPTKPRINNKIGSNITVQEKKRKKLVKRGKSNIINVQGLSHSTPTDDDISNILKEFTVDFLLKGFNSLVKTIHNQILTNPQLQIDTSHFFWLVTYFLKFATQIELDLEHVCSVLSFEIISYLTAEGVNICEQFELAIKLDGNDLKPSTRRLHLVVTAIREFVQAIEVYKKAAHVGVEDQQKLLNLKMKMCETEELRSLLVLLLRYYNPKYHSKQYLQDLIVTNHILLLFLDGAMKLPEYKGTGTMVDHVKQFASPEIMSQYGLLLEDYEGNGEFVNDCVFTVMHHVGGELGSLITLFQPQILKTFTSIWKSEFEICDDWSDLIEYVINTFVKKPHSLHSSPYFRLEEENFDDDQILNNIETPQSADRRQADNQPTKRKSVSSRTSTKQRWTDEEISSLSWNYMQCNTSPDVIGDIVKMFKEDGIYKSRKSIIRELLNQFLINSAEFDKLMKVEMERNCNVQLIKKEIRDTEIAKLCDQLTQDGKSKFLIWVQSVILETCNVKIYLKKKAIESSIDISSTIKRLRKDNEDQDSEVKENDLLVMSPVSYHYLLLNKSIPLVPWNCEQAAICKDLKFLQLLHKLGFHMPVDSGKVFIRIPHFWTPDFLYEVAAKIAPIDTSKLKFKQSDISESSIINSNHQLNFFIPAELIKDNSLNTSTENFYQVHKQKHLASVVNFTPLPGSSFNSSADEAGASNWFEMVQKSQEYKLNLNIHPTILSEDEEMPSISKCEGLPEDVMAREAGTVLTDSVLSTVINVKLDISDFDINHLESEDCNNSVCDTASVASDLTRMYVSDEDEKPERPLVTPRSPRSPRSPTPEPHMLFPPPF